MYPLIYLAEAASTNDEVLKFLPSGRSGAALYTFCQTAGRGQYGSTWNSLAGQNLAYSLAVPCADVLLPPVLFNYHTAILIRDFADNVANSRVQIKWPNDLILRRKKICGMLIEKVKTHGGDFYVIGIGVNVNQTDFSALPGAGSLKTATGSDTDIEKFTQDLHRHLSENILNNISPESLLAKYNGHLFRRGAVSVFERDGIRQNGIIREADAQGFLWVEMEKDGLQKFYHKEIRLLY